jgi:hypothetical protein
MVYGSYPDKQSKYIHSKLFGHGSGGTSQAIVYASPEKPGDKVFQMHELGGSQTLTRTRKRRDSQGNWISYDEQGNRIKERESFIAKYQARPFLVPALKKCLPYIPEMWKAEFERQIR